MEGTEGQRRITRIERCDKYNKDGHNIKNCERIDTKCNTCGKLGHKWKNCYRNQICEKCKRKGYTEKVCRNKKTEEK